MQFYRLFKKIIWKGIYVLQDDFINKALPFAKLSPWVCWWIWIFLSFLRKFHVSDFIPIGTLCIAMAEAGGPMTYGFFAVICLLSAFFSYYFVPETRGKNIQELSNLYRQ